jgi:hypothetical protein
MTPNDSDQNSCKEIDERIERLLAERRNGASPSVIAGKYEEYIH